MSLLFILILLLILVIFYLYDQLKTEYKTKCVDLNFWENKYKEQHKKLTKLVKNIKMYLEKHQIKYWAHGGTLLGTLRHRGFIPWDDDVDLGFLNEKKSDGQIKIINALNDIAINGFIVEDHQIGYKIYDPDDSKIFIDMFEFNIENDRVMQTPFANFLWPKENYILNELFPLKQSKFEDFQVPIPNKSEIFCGRAYGKDYMNIFYIHPPHPDTFIKNLKDGIGISTCSGNKYNINELKK